MNGTTKKCIRQHLMTKQYSCQYQENLDHNPSLIVLIRNPWNALFSEYQRNLNQGNGHIHNVLRDEFDISKFKKFILHGTKRYMETFRVYERFKALDYDVLFVRFENIHNEIWDILKFLFTEKYFKDNYAVFEQRINCIFRNHSILPRMNSIRRPKVKEWLNASLYITKQEAYSKIDRKLLCRLNKRMHADMIRYDLSQYESDEVLSECVEPEQSHG